jgi:hypothetical protein
MALRVTARFEKQADGAAGARKDTKELVKPINNPKGITKSTIKDSVTTQTKGEEVTKPDSRDLRPQDVFQPKPVNINVRSLVDEAWPGVSDDYSGMEKAIRKQIPKDKGYATVKNLSQYLVETGGGGGTKPVGK